VPVAVSLSSSRSLAELHAAAASTMAATPLQAPQDADSSLAQLLAAVERQAQPAEAVTTALVALLRVPSRPRLAFPAGRPAPKRAATQAAPLAGAAAQPGVKQEAAAEDGVAGGAPAGDAGEQLPDASNYMEPYPAVRSLIQHFK
jgi:predicted component of type VI protein secretion system